MKTLPAHRRAHRTVLRASAALLVAFAAQAACAQTWNYDSVRKGGRGKSGGEVAHGTATLEEKDGKALLRIAGAGDDLCVRGDLPATVVRTAETTTIEPQAAVSGCEPFRLVIRNDGSGGQREVKRGDAWVVGKTDHGLTPAR